MLLVVVGLLVMVSWGAAPVGASEAAEAQLSSAKPLVRVGLVADNHYDTFPVGEKAPWQSMKSWFEEQRRRMTTTTKRRYDIAKDKMLEAVSVFNRAEGTTFVVNLGDLVNNDLMWNLRPILDAFNTVRAPHFSILGNHDLRAHNDRFGKNNKTQEAWIRGKMGLGDQWFYSFALGAFRFIFLDSMLLDERGDPKRAEHVKWLEAELAAATAAGQAVVIFGHISIGLNTNAIGPTIKACPHVVAAFFGHEHRGGYTKQGDVHTVILHGQIETLTNAFAMIDVFPDRIEMTGFGRVPTRVLAFSNPDTVAMVKATLARLGTQPLSGEHDLSAVGHTPAPPNKLWGPGDGQEQMPPLQLDIPTYRKPNLQPADANPGTTRFVAEFRTWAKLGLTHAPEEPVDLTDGTAKKGTWLAYPLDGPQGPQSKSGGAPRSASALGRKPSMDDAPAVTRTRRKSAAPSTPRHSEEEGPSTFLAVTLPRAGAGTPRGDPESVVRQWLPAITLLTLLVGLAAASLVLRRKRR
jgi:predicted phosphodiesterase